MAPEGAPPGERVASVEPLDVLIVRDPRESSRKCTLVPVAHVPGIRIVNYGPARRVDAGTRVLLHPDGDLLSPDDVGAPLLMVDCAWRRVPQVLSTIDGALRPRRLPPLVSAYPRKSRLVPDPECGLASIEALYAALVLLGRPRRDLLAAYPFRDAFLAANAGRIETVDLAVFQD